MIKNKLEAEYRLFLKSGDKPNYYKTDAEIKVMLPDLKKGLLQAKKHCGIKRICRFLYGME